MIKACSYPTLLHRRRIIYTSLHPVSTSSHSLAACNQYTQTLAQHEGYQCASIHHGAYGHCRCHRQSPYVEKLHLYFNFHHLKVLVEQHQDLVPFPEANYDNLDDDNHYLLPRAYHFHSRHSNVYRDASDHHYHHRLHHIPSPSPSIDQ
jgi:hypothetical protein